MNCPLHFRVTVLSFSTNFPPIFTIVTKEDFNVPFLLQSYNCLLSHSSLIKLIFSNSVRNLDITINLK